MTVLNLNIPDAEVESLTGPELKAHISAIQGREQTKIASRSEGVRKLNRLRMWARNADGLTGIPKDTQPVVRSYEELQAKAKARGRELPQLPQPSDKMREFDPEWDDPADLIDGTNETVSAAPEPAVTRPGVSDDAEAAAATRGTVEGPEQAEATPPAADPASEVVPPAPFPFTKTAQGVTVVVNGEEITHKRGTLRARLAEQAANSSPITVAASALKDRRPKKETGEARKPREALLAVKATFAGTSKLHCNNESRRTRYEVLEWVKAKALRQTPGWPTGAVLIDEFPKQFGGKDVRPFVHKLLEDGHLERVAPLVPKD